MKHSSCANDYAGAASGTRSRQRGFTLLELMIVVAVIAILSAIAYPSYTSYIVKTKRTAAESCLSEYANYMERYYTTNLSYSMDAADLPTLGCSTQTADDYAYTLANVSSAAYKVQATPVGAQLSRDTKCGAVTLDQTGERGEGGSGTVEQCWK